MIGTLGQIGLLILLVLIYYMVGKYEEKEELKAEQLLKNYMKDDLINKTTE